MDILVLGGTRFIGRHFVSAAWAGGHRVTTFHLAETAAGLLAAETADPTAVGDDEPAQVGLDRARERALLDEWHSELRAS